MSCGHSLAGVQVLLRPEKCLTSRRFVHTLQGASEPIEVRLALSAPVAEENLQCPLNGPAPPLSACLLQTASPCAARRHRYLKTVPCGEIHKGIIFPHYISIDPAAN